MQLSSCLSPAAALTSLLFVTFAAAATPCTTALAKPTPSGYTCETQGSLKKPAVLYTISPFPTIKDCWQECLSKTTCLSYGYNPSSKVCTLYTKTLAAQGYTKGNTGTIFAARNCYTCQCAAGLTKCGSTCTNVKTDGLNCGRCGNTCKYNSVCQASACTCANKSGFKWQVNAPSSPYNNQFIGLASYSNYELSATTNASQILVFAFQGHNITTTAQNESTIGVIYSNTDPATNPPNINNTDGTSAHVAAVGLATPDNLNNPDNAGEYTTINCTAAAGQQLFCQNFNTINEFLLCPLAAASGNTEIVLAYADNHANGGAVQCENINLSLYCP